MLKNFRYSIKNSDGSVDYKKVVTTPGRVKLFELLPDICKAKYGFTLVNMPIGKKEISKIINIVFEETNQTETGKFCDSIMQLGFKNSTFSGISIGKDDMIIPADKTKMINKAEKEIKIIENQYQDGLITSGERYNKVIEIWDKCINSVKKLVVKEMSVDKSAKTANSLE